MIMYLSFLGYNKTHFGNDTSACMSLGTFKK